MAGMYAVLSGCTGVCAVLSGCTWVGVVSIWQAVGARERVFLQFGRHVCSAEWVRVSGCSYHLAGMFAMLSGRT